METQTEYAYPLAPYKTLGLFVDGPVALSQVAPFNVAVACDQSFKIYSQDLAIRVVSPAFPTKIKAIATHNQSTYVYSGSTLYKMEYCHLKDKWEIPSEQQNSIKSPYCNILLFDRLILLQQHNKIHIISQQSETPTTLSYQFPITSMIHPITYINKLLISNSSNLLLINPISQKIIYKFKNIVETVILTQKQTRISWIKETPLTDIVAIGLENNQIMIANIKKDVVVFVMKQKNQISAVGFDANEALMATGDVLGNIILWDLQGRRIVYRFENAFNGSSISYIFFNQSNPILTAMSTDNNSIKQYRINMEDNKTLSLYRERCGSTQPIQKIVIANNKEICYFTQNSMAYSSLYTHTNNYLLPNSPSSQNLGYHKVIGSFLPYHIVAHNYKLILYKERTPYSQGIVPHKQYATTGIISISGYLIIVTKSKVLKMRVNKPLDRKQQKEKNARNVGKIETVLEWDIDNVSAVQLYNEKYIFMFKKDALYVYQFNTNNFVTCINDGKKCLNHAINLPKNLLAFEVKNEEEGITRVEIWDMNTLKSGRIFVYENQSKEEQVDVTCLAFTSDNRYLLVALSSKLLLIWSIIDNILYQTIPLEQNIKTMSFTPDGSYFLTVYKSNKEIFIWNNYIGKIITQNTNNETLKLQFTPKIKSMPVDYRTKLQGKDRNLKLEENLHQNMSISEYFLSILSQIEPEENEEDTEHYDFKEISKWLPLVYYDQIRERNAIQSNTQQEQNTKQSGIPFFLDFSNITEQKQKLHQEIRQELLQKKRHQNQKRDSLLKDDIHSIKFVESDKPEKMNHQYLDMYEMIIGLSVAQVDYQLRRYLMGGINCQYEHMGNMFIFIYENYVRDGSPGEIGNAAIYNVLLKRYLDLLGSDICREELKAINKKLLQITRQRYNQLEEIVWRDTAILQNRNIK